MALTVPIYDILSVVLKKMIIVQKQAGWAEGNFRWGLLSNKKNGFLSKNFTF